jgi:2-succinyl-5-enolpyruvyl-6-hydroxy-3-cyclohexene-1-carboxylate synthase
MPAQWNLQLSNGMSVRYALTADLQKFSRIECNRGVSGIDGSVSTAVGAAMQMPTLLITGDMSMQYDIAALSSLYIDGKLRIAVINNGGGGIFRYISTTSSLPETPQLINGQLRLPLKQLAEAYNCQYVAAHNYAELAQAMEVVANSKQSNAVILEIITDSDIDAKIMHNYNNYKHSN